MSATTTYTNRASIDPASGAECKRFPSMSIDYAIEGWRYVIALAKS